MAADDPDCPLVEQPLAKRSRLKKRRRRNPIAQQRPKRHTLREQAWSLTARTEQAMQSGRPFVVVA